MLRLAKGSFLAFVFLIAVWAVSGGSLALLSGDAAAARNAMSSTDMHSVPPLVSATGCGASGTIADQSGFEDADGNLAIDKAGCMDWNGFAPMTWTGSVPYQNATATSGGFTFFGASDAVDSHTDTMYAGGVKQADECPKTITGNVDNKADIARIYMAASTDPATKHVYLDLAWIRAPQNTTSSDVHVGFEFNQNKTPCGAGSLLVHRTPGDILLVYNFQSGSASIAYSQWTGSAWTPEKTLVPSIAEATVFGGTSTTDAIKPSNGLNPATDEFGEAGIDLTAATVGLGNDGRACERFGTAFGESRTSGSSTSAQMKDLVGPANIDISNCATPTVTTTQKPATGEMAETFKDTATLSGGANYDGTGSITFTLYSAPDCQGSVHTETVDHITANGDYTTPDGVQLDEAGTYYWVASFNHDGHNNDSTTGCNDEPVEVKKAVPSILTTQQPASASVGDTYKDTATLSKAVNLTGKGSITFTLYSAAGCDGTVLDTETVSNISANGSYTTPTGVDVHSSGTYYWVASFSGDANNESSTGGCNDEPVVVNPSSIHIVKTADAAQVSIGDPIGFTLTVYNTGAGDAKGVTLSDTLPTNAGLSWQIESQGAGWAASCAISAGTLHCGPVTVPGGTTEAASKFTVHITSPTTSATGGFCPGGGGVVDNTGTVTTTNDGSDQSEASTCVGGVDIRIVKTADAAQVSAGDPIGFTLTVSNTGTGDAKGVTLSDPLPTNAGLSWQIASQGSGWGGTCAIALGTLTCGPVTVPAGTTQAASTFTVHITSPTTAATGGTCSDGSGVVDNTGSVTTTNDGSDQSSASTCVLGASIHILKTADEAQVNAGDQIGFTLTVYNAGTGDAKGVTLSDPLPTNAGLSWQIETQGAGWGGTCAIALGTLTCGPVTVPTGATQAASTFTVHITSPTSAGTGGDCPETGVVNNTGSVTTTNDGSDQSSASTCVQSAGLTDLQITKMGSPATQDVPPPFKHITWTMVVTNNGPLVDTNVMVTDPMPAGNTYVSSNTKKGSCTGGAILSCNLGTLDVDESVTITLVTAPTIEGLQVNTATVAGDLTETTLTNNTATARVLVVAPHVQACTAVHVKSNERLMVGRTTTMYIKVTQKKKGVVRGVRVRIAGAGVHVTTRPSNAKGKITQKITPTHKGTVSFTPVAVKPCNVVRIGTTDVFAPRAPGVSPEPKLRDTTFSACPQSVAGVESEFNQSGPSTICSTTESSPAIASVGKPQTRPEGIAVSPSITPTARAGSPPESSSPTVVQTVPSTSTA
jgi:uncharacterized repeat protein (TIGR01451 family)